ncbi:hypothetical protein [Phascolarctobacterium faecium]|uniref:hypothetical protein n=1 Tax=Phascolarctobacterium faecium TaxID=33025 RepID=UPI002FDC9DEA
MDALTLTGIKNILKTALAVCRETLKLAGLVALIAALIYFVGFFWSLGKEAAATVIEYYIWRGGIF